MRFNRKWTEISVHFVVTLVTLCTLDKPFSALRACYLKFALPLRNTKSVSATRTLKILMRLAPSHAGKHTLDYCPDRPPVTNEPVVFSSASRRVPRQDPEHSKY